MSDAFGKVVAILICSYLMFIAPGIYMLQETEKTKQAYLLNEVTCFVEDVKNTGIISSERYNTFTGKIYALSGGYEIKLVHSIHSYDESGEGIIFNESNTFTTDIIKELEVNGVYYLKETDYFKVTIYDEESPVCFFGGGIKYEAY